MSLTGRKQELESPAGKEAERKRKAGSVRLFGGAPGLSFVGGFGEEEEDPDQ